MLYAKINVKSNHFLFLTSLESPLNKGGSEGVWKYRWLRADDFAKELIRLFKAGYDIDELKKYAADYGNEALAKFNDLLELLKKSKVNIEVSWTNAKFKIHESKSVKEHDKQIIIDNLVRSIEKTEEFKYQGQFYSLNTRSGQFSFETNDKPTLAIRGKFDDAIKDRVHSLSFEQLYEIIIGISPLQRKVLTH